MIFPDNDRPGVMLAGAADKYARAFGVACGRRVVIAANSDSAYRVAASLRAAGVNVVALIDRRARANIDAAAADGAAGSRGLKVFSEAGIARVSGRRPYAAARS